MINTVAHYPFLFNKQPSSNKLEITFDLEIETTGKQEVLLESAAG